MIEPENKSNISSGNQEPRDGRASLVLAAGQRTGVKPEGTGGSNYNVDANKNNNSRSSSSGSNTTNTIDDKIHNRNSISSTEAASAIARLAGEAEICSGSCSISREIKIENYKEAPQMEQQMRSSRIESPQPQLPAASRAEKREEDILFPRHPDRSDGRIEVERCRLLADSGNNDTNLGERLSGPADEPNCRARNLSNRSVAACCGGGGGGSGGGGPELEQKDLEVEWTTASLFKRASRFSAGSRSLCVRTGLVKSLSSSTPSSKAKVENGGNKLFTPGQHKTKYIGRTIKSFVDNFRSNLNDSTTTKTKLENRKSKELRCSSSTNGEACGVSSDSASSSGDVRRSSEDLCLNDDGECLINLREGGSEFEPAISSLNQKKRRQRLLNKNSSSENNNFIRTSYSCQSMLINNPAAIAVGSGQREFETTIGGIGEDQVLAAPCRPNTTISSNITHKLIMDRSQSSNITNFQPIISANSGSGGCLAKNKYIIEDKLKRQKQQQQQQHPRATSGGQARMEYRRSTHCSSIGVVTSDIMNYDSSLSSVNNCSESNNTCTTTNRQCSGDGQMGRGPGGDDDFNESNICNRPPGSNQCKIHQIVSKTKRNTNPEEGEPLKERDNWDKNIEFLLAVIGFAVDLGNVWRFPYICYKNGGGAFLIPYTVMFILGGLPIFYLEMSLGQYFSSGCLTVWKRVCPMAKGIGYAMCVLNFFTGLYYNTIISWAVFFFVESFTDVLPWTSCNNSWNSGDCRTIDQRQNFKSNISSSFSPKYQIEVNQTQQQVHFSSPTKDYFEREVLQVHLSSGIDDLGYVRKPLAIYLAIVFIFIYFAIWKGVKSTGKAVWITALLPYFVLIPLLIRGVFLEGAWLGIKYYLSPQWVKITDVDVWVEAAKQIYFSLGPGFGTLMALSSYNKFNHNCRRDALIAASVNYFASFISGLVIFAVLGYMATIENVNISDVATEGPGLVFQVYPEGLATMRFSSMWSVLFFIMVITLGIDSTFGGLESVITGLCDEYPRLLRAHRGIFIGFLIILIYLCSLPTTTYGGNYVIYVLESYGTSLSLLFIVLVETIIVCWLYGADRFCKNLEEMYGETPGMYWYICWKYISPTILLIIFIAACSQELDKYHTLTNGDYTYPGWAPTVGLLMTGSSVCCIPIYAIYYLKTKASGSFIERLKTASRPIEGDQRIEKEIYVDALSDKIRDGDIHLDTVI